MKGDVGMSHHENYYKKESTFVIEKQRCAGHSENGVVQCLPCKVPRSTVEMYGKRKTIARCPCTPPLTLETFGEKISAKACSGKEIAGLKRKKKKNMMT